MIDYDVQRCTRRCAATDHSFQAGEVFFSVLRMTDQGVCREDYCQQAWEERTEPEQGKDLAWWQSRMATTDGSQAKLAPNEVLLGLFDQWADCPDRADARYVLALLLIRRKLFRLDVASTAVLSSELPADEPEQQLTVYCPGRDEVYKLPVSAPTTDRAAEIQMELNQLLYADAA